MKNKKNMYYVKFKIFSEVSYFAAVKPHLMQKRQIVTKSSHYIFLESELHRYIFFLFPLSQMCFQFCILDIKKFPFRSVIRMN